MDLPTVLSKIKNMRRSELPTDHKGLRQNKICLISGTLSIFMSRKHETSLSGGRNLDCLQKEKNSRRDGKQNAEFVRERDY